MAMDVTTVTKTEAGSEITATAGDRTVEIELDRITPRTSRMRVVVKKNWFLRDRSTAGEIIARSEEHTSELQSHLNLVCRLLLEKKKTPHSTPSDKITSTQRSFTLHGKRLVTVH